MEQNYKERTIMTVHQFGKDFDLIHSAWEWNDEKFEHFDLLFSGHRGYVVGHWNYCPLYREMIEKIENWLEGGE